MAGITEANNAYKSALNQIKSTPVSSGETSGASFSDLIKQSVSSAIDAQHKSEQVSASALMGNADMTDVIQSINDAEIALNTVLAVRDKVISAYQNIMNTSI